MAGRYFSGTIDGIELKDLDGEDAGFTLTGVEAFDMGEITGTFNIAADGTPHEIQTPLLPEGNELELTFLHCPATLLRAVLEAIKARIATGESFPCAFEDGFQLVNQNFKARTPNWYSRGEPDGDYINDAVLRLICA
jgi:hypothetical protein